MAYLASTSLDKLLEVAQSEYGWVVFELFSQEGVRGSYLARQQEGRKQVVPLPVGIEDDVLLDPRVLGQLCRRLEIPLSAFGIHLAPP